MKKVVLILILFCFSLLQAQHTTEARRTIVITAANKAPQIMSFSGPQTANVGVNVFFKLTVVDDDGYVWVIKETIHGKDSTYVPLIANVPSDIEQQHKFDQPGLQFVKFIVRDKYYTKSSLTWNVNVTPVTDVDDNNSVPTEFALHQNYPNPFNPTTTISYSLPEQLYVKMFIYNVAGAVVAELVNEIKGAGLHSVIFKADGLSSGMYLAKIQAGKYSATKKIILLK